MCLLYELEYHFPTHKVDEKGYGDGMMKSVALTARANCIAVNHTLSSRLLWISPSGLLGAHGLQAVQGAPQTQEQDAEVLHQQHQAPRQVAGARLEHGHLRQLWRGARAILLRDRRGPLARNPLRGRTRSTARRRACRRCR